ncbi:acetyl-coenzyme A transporter 1-like [Brachionus plicatilis]|uniref:Acetyl-coenzyme A transporter 1-like n=1 Tax=Brachionus plicatilis TaxID=10195 RepID=A0A3M7QHL6_BRAPC|nr:acetyl-coenzyme A transporter 1-like [Brachionus plicatilis]
MDCDVLDELKQNLCRKDCGDVKKTNYGKSFISSVEPLTGNEDDAEECSPERMEFHDNEIKSNNPSLMKRIKDLDLKTVSFLIFLYILQGIPVGISTAIPLILSTKKSSYSHQGIYSFTRWPFSVRILWAPIIDRVFINKIGRRKTWIFICQSLSGILMLATAKLVQEITNFERTNTENSIYILTAIFTILVLFSATNDITLDAWSIDLLLE